MKRRSESESTRNPAPWVRVALAAFALGGALLPGCATTGGEGSETHFLCKTDADCTERAKSSVCVNGECSNASGCAGASTLTCADFCGSDAFELPVCVGGAWTCPPNTVPFDQCAPGTCSVPPGATTCCTANGTRTFGPCPDGGENVECPLGSFHAQATSCDSTCAVTTGSSPPAQYHVGFHFTNASNANVAVWMGCTPEYDLTTCGDGYVTPIAKALRCQNRCPETACSACAGGACYDEPAPATATTPVTDTWFAQLDYPRPSTNGDCGCYDAVAATPGRYRISVPVYSGIPAQLPSGGFDKQVLYRVSVDFVLAEQANVEVTVPLDRATDVDGGTGTNAGR